MNVAVLIGRFQPFHNGHAGLLERALATAPKVLVVLGSSFHARNAKNPFTWHERVAMIEASLGEAEKARITFVPVRDYYNDQRWSAAVQRKVEVAAGAGAHITLVGYEKDASSYYLNHFPTWQMETVALTSAIDATDIRRAYFESENMDVTLSVIGPSVPLPVRQYLRTWSMLPDYAGLVEEQRFIAKYKAAWAKAPYAPIFVTVDAVVRCAGHVLLIQRGGFPGKGQWAVPGGFVEQRERLLQSAMRELEEETRLGVLASTLEGALVDVKVFDHPGRSQRGRTITHAHYFDLTLDSLPVAEAADDAAALCWVPITDLAGMEETFYEDHFHILDQFLALSGDD
ncbi:MAG TPA: bifunctional nicotinamide-nucleotide adenylyltransferase/Nudix hydroxylase [Telluria sp.]|jgi:bifunctional NMN adenylyltransferase/nudix hydrolase